MPLKEIDDPNAIIPDSMQVDFAWSNLEKESDSQVYTPSNIEESSSEMKTVSNNGTENSIDETSSDFNNITAENYEQKKEEFVKENLPAGIDPNDVEIQVFKDRSNEGTFHNPTKNPAQWEKPEDTIFTINHVPYVKRDEDIHLFDNSSRTARLSRSALSPEQIKETSERLSNKFALKNVGIKYPEASEDIWNNGFKGSPVVSNSDKAGEFVISDERVLELKEQVHSTLPENMKDAIKAKDIKFATDQQGSALEEHTGKVSLEINGENYNVKLNHDGSFSDFKPIESTNTTNNTILNTNESSEIKSKVLNDLGLTELVTNDQIKITTKSLGNSPAPRIDFEINDTEGFSTLLDSEGNYSGLSFNGKIGRSKLNTGNETLNSKDTKTLVKAAQVDLEKAKQKQKFC